MGSLSAGGKMALMRNIRIKMQEHTGASLSLALLFFVLCAVAGSIVLTAASTALGRTQGVAKKDQRSYAVESAAALLSGEFRDLGVLQITEKRTVNQYVRTMKTTTTKTNDNGTPNNTDDDVTETHTETESETFYTVYYGDPKDDSPITCAFVSPDGTEKKDSEHKNWIVSSLFDVSNASTNNKVSNLYAKNNEYEEKRTAPAVTINKSNSELYDYQNSSEVWNLPVLSGGNGTKRETFTISVNDNDKLKVDGEIQIAGTGTITIDLKNGDESEDYEKYRMNLEIPVSEKNSSTEEENSIDPNNVTVAQQEMKESDKTTHVEVKWERSFTQTKVTELSWDSPTVRRGNVLEKSGN